MHSLRLSDLVFILYLWGLPLSIKQMVGGVLISELRLFKASFLSKQKIIQLMCAIQVFPFADLCISREIKASFVFYRALELKFDAYQLPAFSEGYLQAKKQRKKRQSYRSKSYEA